MTKFLFCVMIASYLFVAFVTLLLLIVVVNAAEVSQADQDACKPDVFKFCKIYIPFYPFDGGSHVILCLVTNRLHLAPACQKTLRKHGV